VMECPPRMQAPPPQVDNLMDLLDLGGDDELSTAPPATTAASTGEPACVALSCPPHAAVATGPVACK
jgi:hypothetical protein